MSLQTRDGGLSPLVIQNGRGKVYKSKPKSGKYTEEEGDLLYEDNVNVENLLYMRNMGGKHISRVYGPLVCRFAE